MNTGTQIHNPGRTYKFLQKYGIEFQKNKLSKDQNLPVETGACELRFRKYLRQCNFCI